MGIISNANKIRIAIVAVLVLAIVLLPGITDSGKSLEVSENHFAVNDTSGITMVVLNSNEGEIIVNNKGGNWYVGNSEIDEALRQVLIAVLNKVNVKRQLPDSQEKETVKQLKENGIQVSVFKGDNKVKEFVAGGNENRTISYMALPDLSEIYIVNIPGYQDYVTGIFGLDRLAWKSKAFYKGDPRTLKSFAIVNNEGDTAVKIKGEGVYFSVNNLSSQLDSTRMDQYLSALFNLRIDTHLNPEEYPVYASYMEENDPAFSYIIDDISYDSPRIIEFYPVPQRQGFYFTQMGANLAVFRQNDVEQLIVPAEFFKKETSNQSLF
ncbi:DUF4340 domain-containing protein [Mangrovivirga cuniculi]|uniref:DUF4340 domain-containing protein n=1 Tax=Mangrovivirga cuniculi TaxID=2715131 RepID=A0A4D7JEA4_9BACT|nr:DUF4340 domain-containing protein [Mangrovivirga cuniculi]QCK14569.1 hypothetical protein DCC35_07345 [Mangrovivirga cuniculi]